MEQWIENDARDAVRTVYDEFLLNRYPDNPETRLHRLLGFEQGYPAPGDANALTAARNAYVQTIGGGGKGPQATSAARDALYGELDRERFIKLEADPRLYRTSPLYHREVQEKAGVKVEEERQERNQEISLANAPTQTSSFEVESNQEPSQQQPQIASELAAELTARTQLGPIVRYTLVHNSQDKFQGARQSDSEQHSLKHSSSVQRSEVREAAKGILATPAEGLRTEDRRQRDASADKRTTNPLEIQTSPSQKREEKIDLKRYAQDPDYRREVKEQVTKRQGQDQQNQRQVTLQRSRPQ